ncbi:MAG: glyoxylate/hydroxypyruvate reductase A [Kiloniella sp.]|nr:glyoxylate/hydroxypyruvate reductase A [Kiloniella sp.]
MKLLLKNERHLIERWCNALHNRVPGLEVSTFPFVGDPAEVDVALVWEPPQGLLASMENLRLVISTGAGVDHILRDPSYPRHVPLVRMVDPGLTQGMVEYVVMATLLCTRRMHRTFANHANKVWQEEEVPLATDCKVGIMGIGVLGEACASALLGMGYNVMGWSRSPKQLDGVETYHGINGLEMFLNRAEVLVCLLPLTPETEGILGRGTFNRLPQGAAVINAGRGAHLVEEDLLAALERGRVEVAVLDVFQEEPLPPDNPLWEHPNVFVTPHIAAVTTPETAIFSVADAIDELRHGQPLSNQVDLEQGY